MARFGQSIAGELIDLGQSFGRAGGISVDFSQAGSGLSNMAMTAVLRRMGHGDITTHGFRSTFRDWAAERTNFPNHVVEQALLVGGIGRDGLVRQQLQIGRYEGCPCRGAAQIDPHNWPGGGFGHCEYH